MSQQFADKNFEHSWFSSYKGNDSPTPDLTAIRDYAFNCFDKLDANKNGFIEMKELRLALADPNADARERSFIIFLLNNHKEICDSFKEPGAGNPDGISRDDIESYFKLVISLVQA